MFNGEEGVHIWQVNFGEGIQKLITMEWGSSSFSEQLGPWFLEPRVPKRGNGVFDKSKYFYRLRGCVSESNGSIELAQFCIRWTVQNCKNIILSFRSWFYNVIYNSIAHRENYIICQMTFYKDKIQKELENTIQNFKNNQRKSFKTRRIEKQAKAKRVFKPRNSFHQQPRTPTGEPEPHVLNFYNFFSVNQKAIRDPEHHESYVQSNFYYKIIKKIQVKEHYIVLFLNNSGLLPNEIQETLQKFKRDENANLRFIGQMLQNLSQKMNLPSATHAQGSDISLTLQTYEMLDSLGSTAFICKLFSQKLIISKSMLELEDYTSQDFIIQSLKYKMPLFESFSCKNYSQIVQSEITFYSNLYDVLHGLIPVSSFLETASTLFSDTITSKNNMQYECEIQLSMPIPLVELIKVTKILKATECGVQEPLKLFDQKFKKYQQKIWQKQNLTLQYLKTLPTNCLPSNRLIIADYESVCGLPCSSPEVKQELFSRKCSNNYSSKNSTTLSNIKEESNPNLLIQ